MQEGIDMTDQKFGEWTVHSRVLGTTGPWVWLCQCSCKRWGEVRGNLLRSGQSRACHTCVLGENGRDLTGERFTDWLVVRRSDPGHKGAARWWCRCVLCDEEKDVAAHALLRGKSRRCTSCAVRLTHLSKKEK